MGEEGLCQGDHKGWVNRGSGDFRYGQCGQCGGLVDLEQMFQSLIHRVGIELDWETCR